MPSRKDISPNQVRAETQLSDSKLQIEVAPELAEQLVAGTVTFFRKQRWAVLQQDSEKLTLKRF